MSQVDLSIFISIRINCCHCAEAKYGEMCITVFHCKFGSTCSLSVSRIACLKLPIILVGIAFILCEVLLSFGHLLAGICILLHNRDLLVVCP